MSEKPKITGYRDLTKAEIDAMNEVKATANTVKELLDEIAATPGIDQRWVAIARTELQQGFMALIRAIAQPDSF